MLKKNCRTNKKEENIHSYRLFPPLKLGIHDTIEGSSMKLVFKELYFIVLCEKLAQPF